MLAFHTDTCVMCMYEWVHDELYLGAGRNDEAWVVSLVCLYHGVPGLIPTQCPPLTALYSVSAVAQILARSKHSIIATVLGFHSVYNLVFCDI